MNGLQSDSLILFDKHSLHKSLFYDEIESRPSALNRNKSLGELFARSHAMPVISTKNKNQISDPVGDA